MVNPTGSNNTVKRVVDKQSPIYIPVIVNFVLGFVALAVGIYNANPKSKVFL
jgi:hypothetical protein